MSTKKKVTPKAPEVLPNYSIDQKVFTIIHHKAKPEELHEVKIIAISKRETAIRDMSGKKIGIEAIFSYYVLKPDGFTGNLFETELYPTFVSAAQAFAKGFLALLK